MRRKIIIRNLTRWRTDHLRRYCLMAAAVEFDYGTKPLVIVTFKPIRGRGERGGVSGIAAMGGTHCTIRVSNKMVDREELALTLRHEFAHLRGMTHAQMRGSPLYRLVTGWRKFYQWELPLDAKPEPKKPAKPTRTQELQRLEQRIARWESKRKRAETALKKLRKEHARRAKRLAAEPTPIVG